MQAVTDFTQVFPTSQLNSYHTLESLLAFQYQAKPVDFAAIFGEATGDHLWAKFSRDYDILRLYSQLDGPNRRRFARWLEGGKDD